MTRGATREPRIRWSRIQLSNHDVLGIAPTPTEGGLPVNFRRCLLFLLPLALGLLLAATPGLAETINCTAITSVPFTISAPGIYCLTQNLNQTDPETPAIQINVSNVVLDLNGWTLRGDSGLGVVASLSLDVRHVTVKNGTIRGFLTAVTLGNPVDTDSERTSGAVAESLRVLGPAPSTPLRPPGHRRRSRRHRPTQRGQRPGVRRARTTRFRSSESGPVTGSRVVDNDVMRIRAVGTPAVVGATGIVLEHGAMAIENRISDVSVTRGCIRDRLSHLDSEVQDPGERRDGDGDALHGLQRRREQRLKSAARSPCVESPRRGQRSFT